MKTNKLHLPAMFHVIDARTAIVQDPLFGISKEAFDSCYPKLNDDFKNKTPFIFGTAKEIFNEMDFVKNKAAYFFDQSLNKISVLPNKEFLSKEQIVKIYDKLWKTNYLKPLQ